MESSPDNSELSEHLQFSYYNQFAYVFAFKELQLQFQQFYCIAASDFHITALMYSRENSSQKLL